MSSSLAWRLAPPWPCSGAATGGSTGCCRSAAAAQRSASRARRCANAPTFAAVHSHGGANSRGSTWTAGGGAGREAPMEYDAPASAWEAPPFSSWPAGPAARSLAGITPQLLEAIRAEDEALQALPGTVRARLDSARASLPRRVMSPEHRAKISDALKGRSVNGRRLSSEHKAAISRGVSWSHRNTELSRKISVAKLNGTPRCSACGMTGHNKRTCALARSDPDAQELDG